MFKINDVLIQKKDMTNTRSGKEITTRKGTMWFMWKIDDGYWIKPLDSNILGGKDYGMKCQRSAIIENFLPANFNLVQAFADIFSKIYDVDEVVEVFSQMGIETKTVDGDSKYFDSVMIELIDKFKSF